MNTWATRIKERMKDMDITQEELARKMGITRGAITHYLAGRRVPPLRQFQKLASILKADPAWLQFGTIAQTSHSDNKLAAKNIKAELTRHAIPILTWEQAAEFDTKKFKQDAIKEWLLHFYADQSQWYALRIQGDAMTAPLGGQIKSFHEGDIIIVDPDKTALHGNYVIAILPRSNEATFKQYVVDGGVRYLKPLNPQYPLTQINDSTHICGVVVGCLSINL